MKDQFLLDLMFQSPLLPPLLLPFSPFCPPLPNSRFASALGIVFSYHSHPLTPPQFSPFLSVFIVSPFLLTRPHSQCLPLSLSAPTPRSKVSCLTVNVLSFPRREAARRQRENYSVLHSINLHCVTLSHTHTHTYGWLACVLSCEFVPGGTYCLSISVCVCVCVDMRGHRASQQF